MCVWVGGEGEGTTCYLFPIASCVLDLFSFNKKKKKRKKGVMTNAQSNARENRKLLGMYA